MENGVSLEGLRAAAQDDVRALRNEITTLSDAQISLILTQARSHYAWTDTPVSDDLLHQIFDIMKMGPTSMNTCPSRIIFVRSVAGKERLAKALKPANVPKVMTAPITAIIAYDVDFWEELPRLFPHEDRRPHFKDKPAHAEDTAYRNSTLQGAYFMIAARALGLDIGAISGFDNAVVDDEFFAGTSVKSNFLCNLGYADEAALFQRLPRFAFDDVCDIL
ncbi:MAG: malonic semialdehyde reductase [Octadecabacter sp.]|jgi:3-hydroxypropanoate dehydrogenase|nr:malonic semialdehyde reductase [Octadecabacter sp.]MDC1229133.1 malonic semialdehyde reductase [Octadecabacter sp.]